MKIIKKTLQVTQLEYYKKHLAIVNTVLPVQMTPKQLEVIANFMFLENTKHKDPFNGICRKIVMHNVGISPGGLGNYLNQLKKLGFLLLKDGYLTILPILIPEKGEQEYQFKLILKDEDLS